MKTKRSGRMFIRGARDQAHRLRAGCRRQDEEGDLNIDRGFRRLLCQWCCEIDRLKVGDDLVGTGDPADCDDKVGAGRGDRCRVAVGEPSSLPVSNCRGHFRLRQRRLGPYRQDDVLCPRLARLVSEICGLVLIKRSTLRGPSHDWPRVRARRRAPVQGCRLLPRSRSSSCGRCRPRCR